jgi:predicted phosphate transport protein (TIGR00153 family)
MQRLTMLFFGRKQRAVESLIERYLDRVDECIGSFAACLESMLGGDPFEVVVEKARATHQAESRADDTRREICILLYGKALFPESRGDILGLLESTDKLANAADAVVRKIRHQHLSVPTQWAGDVRELVARSCTCSRELVKAVRMLFQDYHSAMHLADRVGELESRADDSEFALIEKIFCSDLTTGEKILLRDLVSNISDIADRAENAGDRVRIVAIKRKI